MLLHEPDATPLDLRFRLFGTYVRVHPLFWLISVLLGWNVTDRHVLSESGFVELAIWVACVFFSILLHEFGHIWMGRVFGSDGHILLQGMGGLAIGANNLYRRWQRILVCAAGPAIQLLLYGALIGWLWTRALTLSPGVEMKQPTVWGLPVLGLVGLPPAAWLTIEFLVTINLLWALVNLLPIWPLDGGQITREVSESVSPRNGLLASLWISLIVSAVLAINALLVEVNKKELIPYAPQGTWIAILFALFAAGSWQGIQAVRQTRERVWEDNRLPWER